MDLKLTTTTEDLRALVETALDATPLGRMDPVLFEQVSEEVVHTVSRQAVAQLGPRTFERDILAALDRSLTGCLPLQAVYRAATGRDATTLTEVQTTTNVLNLLHAEGLVSHGSGPRGEAGTWFFIMPKGRTKLHA